MKSCYRYFRISYSIRTQNIYFQYLPFLTLRFICEDSNFLDFFSTVSAAPHSCLITCQLQYVIHQLNIDMTSYSLVILHSDTIETIMLICLFCFNTYSLACAKSSLCISLVGATLTRCQNSKNTIQKNLLIYFI